MKKYFIYAASALALASCSSDDFLGDNPGNEQNASSAINFGGETGKITRADNTGEAAANALENNFVVVGFKGTETGKANTTIVFDHYNVNYKANTANSTESNKKNWEYVGQDQKVKGTDPNDKLAAPNTTAQTIKYWDYSATSYDFLAFSMGKGNASKYAKPTGVNKDKLDTEAYTLEGDVNTLSECYITNIATVKKNDYGKTVEMQFRHLTSKVRLAFFETVPGYVISDVKFYEDANATTTSDETGKLFGTFNNKGTYTVYFPKTGTANVNDKDYNNAHVKFEKATSDGTVALEKFAKVVYGNQAEDAITEGNTYLSQNSSKPSYCGTTGNQYINVLPAEDLSQPATIRIDYKLTATDGSGEVINVKGATATVPAEYTAWKPGYAYTYIFRISQNTNGSTGDDDPGKGLTAISFDAVVLDDEETGKQETITTVSTPSITTYGFKDGKVTVNGNEYATGTDIYATVFVPATTTPAPGTAATTVAPDNLYTVTIEDGAAQTINEASVANALAKGKKDNDADPTTWTVIDANGMKMIVTKSTLGSKVTSVPTADGKGLSVNALKWNAGTTATTYAVEYEYTTTSGTTAKAYKIVKVTE